MKSAFLFSLAFFSATACLAIFSDWNPIKKSSSPDFADITFQGNAETSESLQIVLFKRVDDLLNLEKALLHEFNGSVQEHIQDDADSYFIVRDVRVSTPEASLPPVVIVTAIEKGNLPRYFGMQFIIKPHCEKCLLRVDEVKRQFAKARFNEAGTELFLAGRSFELTGLAFSPAPGFSDRMFQDFAAKLIAFGGSALGVAIFVARLCGGAMGYTGPCGNNLINCRCHVPGA